MQSHYYYEYGLAPLPAIAALFAFLSIPITATFDRKHITAAFIDGLPTFALLTCVIFFGIIALLFSTGDFLWSRVLSVATFAPIVYFSHYLLVTRKKKLRNAIKFCILTHLLFFWIQIIGHYTGLGFTDFLQPFTGEEQRVFGGNYTVPILNKELIRPAGLFNEPGTFATFIFLLLLLYGIIDLGSSNKPSRSFELLGFFTVSTLSLSFSLFGFFFVSLYFALSYLRGIRSALIAMPLLMLGAYYAYTIYIFPRFFLLDTGDSGFDFRLEGIRTFWNEISEAPSLLFTGMGYFSDLKYLPQGVVWNDIGLGFFMLFTLGIIGCSFFIGLLFAQFRGLNRYKLMFSIALLVSKLSPSMIFFWFCLSVYLSRAGGGKPIKWDQR